MYKWHIHFRPVYLSAVGDRQLERSKRMYAAGFTDLTLSDDPSFGRPSWRFYHYTTTHKSRSAMMMYSLKYPDDGIEYEEERSDV